MTEYLSCAETAKILRRALRESFPGVKFSVRSHTYSMGASIRVGWTDGPTSKQVKAVTDVFQGATFDGMTDYKGGCVHTYNGKSVHFGADFIFPERAVSDAYKAKMAAVWETLDGRAQCELLNGIMHGSPYRNNADMEDYPRALADTLPVFKQRHSHTAASVKLERTY